MAYSKISTGTEIAADLSDVIRDKTILITGVSADGLGAKFLDVVAPHNPRQLILAGRNHDKVQQVANDLTKSHPSLQVRTLSLDLSSFESARNAANQVNQWHDVEHIDVLVNNAAIMAVPFSKSVDGYESQFATNHLGHFLFTNLIMGKILRSKSPRIVVVGSDGHRLSPVRWSDINFNNGEFYEPWAAYGQAKTANLLFAIGLSRKFGPRGLIAASVHPGLIATNLSSHLDWTNGGSDTLKLADRKMGNKFGTDDYDISEEYKSPDQGVATHIYTAFSPKIQENNGAYFKDSRLADPFQQEVFPWATGNAEADMLWRLSEEIVGSTF